MPQPDYEDDLVFTPKKNLAPCDYNHFIKLTEKLKEQDEKLQKYKSLAENGQSAIDTNKRLCDVIRSLQKEIQFEKQENEKLIENNFLLFMKEDTSAMKYSQIKKILKRCIPIIKDWGVWDEKKQELLNQIKTAIGESEE